MVIPFCNPSSWVADAGGSQVWGSQVWGRPYLIKGKKKAPLFSAPRRGWGRPKAEPAPPQGPGTGAASEPGLSLPAAFPAGRSICPPALRAGQRASQQAPGPATPSAPGPSALAEQTYSWCDYPGLVPLSKLPQVTWLVQDRQELNRRHLPVLLPSGFQSSVYISDTHSSYSLW
jgi:hypothetical protein